MHTFRFGLVSLLLVSACAERPAEVPPPNCSGSECPVAVDAAIVHAIVQIGAPFPYAAYDVESEPGQQQSCGAVLALSDAALDNCVDGHLTAELTTRHLRIRLTSNSDAGSYTLIPPWSCTESMSGVHFTAAYSDEQGTPYTVTDGAVQIKTIGSGLNPIEGSYGMTVRDAQGNTMQLAGSFDAPPCHTGK
jgi:hypothetical protein